MIVVAGIDFSGTSLVAGLLHSAGVDMGDVESEEDVAASTSPLRYRLFEDTNLYSQMAPHAARMLEMDDGNRAQLIKDIYNTFALYTPRGGQQGVKNNGLLFLALYPKLDYKSIKWVTTRRPFGDSVESCRQKLGDDPRFARLLREQYRAYSRLLSLPVDLKILCFDRLMRNPQAEWRKAFGDEYEPDFDLVDRENKGIIPWHGSQPVPL